MNRKLLIVVAAILFTFTGCDYFDNGDTLDISSFEVNINNLPALPDTMTFVGWFDSDDLAAEKVFVLDADQGGNINYKSEKPFKSLLNAQEFVLTVEKKAVANNATLAPSTRKLLAGRFSEAATSLTIGEKSLDPGSVTAGFNLVTPTNGSSTDELSGLWFVDSLSAATPVAGLDLPLLYGGWIYEGWVEINGQLLSTGRFANAKAADLFSNYGGGSAGFSFPGEDFLTKAPTGFTFPTDLSNAKVFVSLEFKDGRTNGTSPFLIILEATVPASAQSGITYPMLNSGAVLTGGNAFMVVDLVK